MRMRVINPEKFQSPLAKLRHQPHDLPGRNLVVPDWIRRDILRRERLRDKPIPPRQNSAAFPMRLAAGMLQNLPIYLAATPDGSLHCGSMFCHHFPCVRKGPSFISSVQESSTRPAVATNFAMIPSTQEDPLPCTVVEHYCLTLAEIASRLP